MGLQIILQLAVYKDFHWSVIILHIFPRCMPSPVLTHSPGTGQERKETQTVPAVGPMRLDFTIFVAKFEGKELNFYFLFWGF